MKLGTLLTNLAKKSGVDVNAQEFIDLIGHDIEVPDAIATKIDNGLMNEEVAKNKLSRQLRTEALNGVDSKIEEILTELGYSEEEIADVKGEKNSYEKVAKLGRTIKALEAKKAGATKAEKADIQKEIDRLQAEVKTAKEHATKVETEWKAKYEETLTGFEIDKILMGKNYSLPEDMDSDVKLTAVKAAVNKALSAKGYKLVRNEQGQLSVVKSDGTKAYSDNNEEIIPQTFIDGALAQNKLLKVTDPNQQHPGNNQHQPSVIPGNGQLPVASQRAISEIDQRIQQYSAQG